MAGLSEVKSRWLCYDIPLRIISVFCQSILELPRSHSNMLAVGKFRAVWLGAFPIIHTMVVSQETASFISWT